jgi:hypothetical protein
MDELIQRVHPVPPGFDPTQLRLSNPEPSTHDLLRKWLVSMRRVISVRSNNRPHVTRREGVSHLVRVPEVPPKIRGIIRPDPAQLATRRAHARAALASQATAAPHAVPSSGRHDPTFRHRPLPSDVLAHRNPCSTASMRWAHKNHAWQGHLPHVSAHNFMPGHDARRRPARATLDRT